MSDNVERNNESQHTLYSPVFGTQIIQEPKGWANDIPSFERDKDSRAILSKTTIDYEFFGDGAFWLETLYKTFGVSEKAFILKHEKDVLSLSEKWKLRYNQQIDMGTYEKDNDTGGVKVKATEGGMTEEIKNRKSDKYDLINQQSADGMDIGELTTYPFQPTARSIYFNTMLKDSQVDYRINSERYKNSCSNSVRTVPLLEVYNPNDAVKIPSNTSPTVNSFFPHDQDETWSCANPDPTSGTYNADDSVMDSGNFFIWRTDIARQVYIDFSMSFKVTDVNIPSGARAQNKRMFVELRKCYLSGNDDLVSEITELFFLDNHHEHIGELQTVTYNPTDPIELEANESLGIVFHTFADLGNIISDGWMDTYINVLESKLIVEDTTDYPVSKSRCIKPFDLFERILAKITGINGIFRSSIFDAGGIYEHMVVDNGFWARGFPDSIIEEDDEPREIQFATSWEEAFNAYNYLEPLCWFEEIDGNTSVIRIETAKYTMKNFVGITLESIDKFSEKAQKTEFFSKITIGTKKSLEFEELNGLDEYNGKSEFTTHVKYASNEYKVESDYRFDPVGYELTRRKQYVLGPKEDTPRDEHIFMHDAKYSVGVYYHNLWSDTSRIEPTVFDSAPTGVFSPETAWNLRMSPMNRLFYGHGYSINRGLYHYPNKYVRFNSSNANKNLKTVYNAKELHEGGSFQVKDLEKARIEPISYEMTFNMTQEIEDDIRGTTKVNGEDVPNYFGMVQFTYRGEKIYGRLVKLEADDESKITVIAAKL